MERRIWGAKFGVPNDETKGPQHPGDFNFELDSHDLLCGDRSAAGTTVFIDPLANITPHALRQEERFRLATDAAFFPSALLVPLGRCAMVRFRFATVAAFLMFFCAALRCLVEGIFFSPPILGFFSMPSDSAWRFHEMRQVAPHGKSTKPSALAGIYTTRIFIGFCSFR